jgi:hypothetical protein
MTDVRKLRRQRRADIRPCRRSGRLIGSLVRNGFVSQAGSARHWASVKPRCPPRPGPLPATGCWSRSDSPGTHRRPAQTDWRRGQSTAPRPSWLCIEDIAGREFFSQSPTRYTHRRQAHSLTSNPVLCERFPFCEIKDPTGPPCSEARRRARIECFDPLKVTSGPGLLVRGFFLVRILSGRAFFSCLDALA